MPLGAFTGGVGPYLERLDFPFAGGQYRHHPARLYEQSPEDSSGRHADPIRPYGSFTAPLPVPRRAFWMKLLRKFPWRYPSSGSAGGRWIGWKSSAGKEPLAFDEKEIQRLLRGKYGVCTERILPARRGFYGETWRAEGPEGAYCIKCDSWGHHQEAYRVSLAAVDFLTAHGIDFVPKAHKMLYRLLARVYRLPAETLSLARGFRHGSACGICGPAPKFPGAGGSEVFAGAVRTAAAGICPAPEAVFEPLPGECVRFLPHPWGRRRKLHA